MSQVALRALTLGEGEKQQAVKVRSGSQCNNTPSFFFQVSSLCVCVLRGVRSSCRWVFCFISVLFGVWVLAPWQKLFLVVCCNELQHLCHEEPVWGSNDLCMRVCLFGCAVWIFCFCAVRGWSFSPFFLCFFCCVSLFFCCTSFSILFVRRECAVKSWSSSWLSYICCFLCLFCKEFRLLMMLSYEDLFRLLRSSHNNNFSLTYSYSFQNGPFLLHCTSIMCLLPFIMS
jgi:hypothetical protein